jgi:acetoacetate decarboxylase
MGFVKSFEEIAGRTLETADFYDAEMLTVFWETKPEIVARLLPPPLEPAKRSLAGAFVANYPRTNFGVSYLEGALLLRASYKGEEGSYILAMPVSDDMAMAGGREIYGYPKKIGNIHFTRSGNRAEGWVERHGVRFFEVKAKLAGKLNHEDAQEVFTQGLGSGSRLVVYNFKHFPAPEGSAFDYSPRLIREEVKMTPSRVELGEAKVTLRASERDPWSEVEAVRVLGAAYTVGNNSMLKGQVVAEVDPIAFAPYSFLKWDF